MPVLDQASGQFVCDFVERLPTTDTGKPFRLYDWQRDTLMEFYSTMERDEESGRLLRQYQYLYLEIPKKNGKSELAAALGLYHLFGDGELNAEVYLCAADKDNASIVFRAAVFMLETAPWTAKMIARGELKVSKSQKKIEYRQRVKGENGALRWVSVGLMQVMSAEAFSKHGYKPSCVIFDELHAQPNRSMWDVMTGAAGKPPTPAAPALSNDGGQNSILTTFSGEFTLSGGIAAFEAGQHFRLRQPVYFIGSEQFIPKDFISSGILFCLASLKDTILIRPRQDDFAAFRQKLPFIICKTCLVFERSIAVRQKPFVHDKSLELHFIENLNPGHLRKEIPSHSVVRQQF